MSEKFLTAFRLFDKTVKRLDKLVASPPAWLDGCAPGPVKDRTDVVERLIFLAEKHHAFGLPSDDRLHDETAIPSSTGRVQKGKKAKKD